MTTQQYSGDQLAKITEFRTHAGELADYLEKLDKKKHDQRDWCHIRNDNGDVCGTPACALGHAVAGGLIPDTELTVLTYGYRIINAGLSIENLRAFNYAGKDIFDEPLFAVPLGEAGKSVSGIEGYPTRGDTWIPWEDIGLEYYGAVVRDQIFYNTNYSLDAVIENLRKYASKGYIEYPKNNTIACHDEESDDLACRVTYLDQGE